MALTIRIFSMAAVFILITWMFIHGAHSQVTFSRDWNPGKRMVENVELHNSMKTASALCHMLINHIRQLDTCQNINKAADLDSGTTTIFTGPR